MMYKKDNHASSLRLVPRYSVITFTGDPFTEHGKVFRAASFTDTDGTVYDGVFRYKPEYFKETDGGKWYVYKYINHGTSEWACCKNLKGVVVRTETTENSNAIIGFIPNETAIEYEDVPDKRGWGKLISPVPDTVNPGPYFIKKQGNVELRSTGTADPSLLGTLIIPEIRPQIKAGNVIGKAGPFITSSDKNIVHIEIFTLQDMKAPDSIPGDPAGERYFSRTTRYVIPPGKQIRLVPLKNVAFEPGDVAKIIGEPAGSEYVKIQVAGLCRIVKRNWLENPVNGDFCSELGISTWSYTVKKSYLPALSAKFNNWFKEKDKVFLETKLPSDHRKVFFSCSENDQCQLWVKKNILGESDESGFVEFISHTECAYAQNPGDWKEKTTSGIVTIDNQKPQIIDDKKFLSYSDMELVDITGVEPQTPFTWGGFELLYEEPGNHDAFMDFDKVKSCLIDAEEFRDTQTGKDLEAAIKTGPGKYDISKVLGDKAWTDRMEKLIIRTPSEWQYSDEKYIKLTNKITGRMDPAEVKKFIKTLAFWDECKQKKVFDETDLSVSFSPLAKEGKEIWAFHPVAFIQQISLLTEAGISADQKHDLYTFIGMIRAAVGSAVSDADSCKAVAASLCYRLRKHEWVDSSNFHALSTRHSIPVQTPTDEEFKTIAKEVSPVFLDRSWSALEKGYVLFHKTTEALSSMPWDTSVLDTAAKSIGMFTFYRYKPDATAFATKLAVREIKLVGGGDKGLSLPCLPCGVLSAGDGGGSKPYRYDVKVQPEWQFEFSFNIGNGTVEMEQLKPVVKWELRYYAKKDGKVREIRKQLDRTGNRFRVQIETDVTDYTVRLVPVENSGEALCSDFTIAIKKKEQMVFNGSVLKWLDENGEAVPFQD